MQLSHSLVPTHLGYQYAKKLQNETSPNQVGAPDIEIKPNLK
jgi:hypothetical protein